MMKSQFYFEDYQVGDKGITNTRTVTEADIVNFACVTADYNRFHLDRHYTASSIYGGRVAHGPLGVSLVAGMLSLEAPHTVGRGVSGGYLRGFDVNYRGAIKLGDTIKTQWNIAAKADAPDHQGFGLVKTGFQVINQDSVAVYDGILTAIVRKESAESVALQLKPGAPQPVREIILDADKIYCMEDFHPGEGGETDGRTITEADIMNFAGITGDYNPQYVDAEFAKKSIFGERIAQGMLIFTSTVGLWSRNWIRYQETESNIAGHLNDRGDFIAPVKIGDTIRCRYATLEARASKSKPELGLVRFGFQSINQRGELVQKSAVLFMIPTKAGLGIQSAV